jgi:hypothetical protein
MFEEGKVLEYPKKAYESLKIRATPSDDIIIVIIEISLYTSHALR